MKNKLFYRWTGCPCTASKEVEVDLKTWSNIQLVWKWNGDLSEIEFYKISDIIQRLNHGEEEVHITDTCSTCFGTGDHIYYFKKNLI